MKSFTCLVILGLFAFTFAAESDSEGYSSEEYDSEEDIDWEQLEKDLENSPFVEVDMGLGAKTAKNRKGLISAFCKCNGDDECGCCAEPKIFHEKLNGCIDFQYNNTLKSLRVAVGVGSLKPISHSFSLEPLETICVPLPHLPLVKICIKTESFEDEENGLRACNSIDLRVIRAAALKVNFNCINLKEGKIGFADGKTSGGALINISVKNPLKVVIDLIKKLKKKFEKHSKHQKP